MALAMDKKWKIVSDGTANGTKVISPDGKVLGYVQKLEINAECGEAFLTAKVKFILPMLDIEVLESSFTDNRADCENCKAECEHRDREV